MKDVVNVKLVSRFDFEDDKSKKRLQGTKIFYEGSVINTDNKKGQEIVQLNSDRYDVFNDFPTVPGKYEIDFSIVPGRNGQVKMVYNSSKFLDKQ